MRPIDFFDNGHDQNPDAVCLIQDETGREYTYAQLRQAGALFAPGHHG